MRERTVRCQGWTGVWMALAVLAGWRAWLAVSGSVDPHALISGAPFVPRVFGLVAALAIAVAIWPGTKRTERGEGKRNPRRSGGRFCRSIRPRMGSAVAALRSTEAVFVLWSFVGLLSGLRASHPSPPATPAATSGERTYHVVVVDEIGLERWAGRLQATWDDGVWTRAAPSPRVEGRGRFPGRGRWIVDGALGEGWVRPHERTSRLDLRATQAYAWQDSVGGEALGGRTALTSVALGRDAWRERTAKRWREVLGGEVGDFAGWVLLGVEPANAEVLREPFVRTGTAHVLAISGLHVGILAAGLWATLRVLLRRPVLARRATAALLLGYAYLTGGAVSVVRSAGMFFFVALGPAWGRLGRAWNGLGWAAALLPVSEPSLPVSPGYVLSVGATAGVLLGARATASLLPGWFGAVSASLGAQVATWSASLHFFSLASWSGLGVNLVVIPLVTLVMPLLLLSGLAALLPWVAAGSGLVALGEEMALLLLRTVALAARGRAMQLGTIPETTGTLAAASALVALWALGRVPRGRRGQAALLAALALTAGFVLPTWLAAPRPLPDRGVRATFLDVGQGDAVLLELPGARWLYDTGPPQPRRLVRALTARGIGVLDRVVLTHGDADHWGGLADLLASPVRVDTLSISASGPWPDPFWDLLARAPQRPHLERIPAGWERTWAGMRCRALHPSPGFEAEGRNDHSVVLHFEDGADGPLPGRGRLLLIGDLEEPGQRHLLDDSAVPVVDVAQAGHHGSGTSLAPGWYEAADPLLVVASLSKTNRYGFPHPDLVSTLATRGVPLERTDLAGAISVQWDGAGWTVRRDRPALARDSPPGVGSMLAARP